MTPRTRPIGGVRCEINMTPLVDVCLVLLIIFMVVAPLLEDRTDLPQTSKPDPMAAAAEDLEVTVGADGHLALREERVTAAALMVLLRQAHASSPARRVVVKADRHLRYDQVRRVLESVAEAGFGGAGLAMHAKQAPAPGAMSLVTRHRI